MQSSLRENNDIFGSLSSIDVFFIIGVRLILYITIAENHT